MVAMENREENFRLILKESNIMRSNLVKRFAVSGTTDELYDIALGFISQAETILVPLLGSDGAAYCFQVAATAIKEKKEEKFNG
jgi:hypothetical protein